MKTAGWFTRIASAAAFLLLMLRADSASAGTVPALLMGPSSGPLAMYVSTATRSVIAKLKKPECLAVLTDFRDGRGHPLTENLETLGMTAPEFYVNLTFVDGSNGAVCGARPLVAAFASPGIPVIAICTPTFARIRRGKPGMAANLLIHEMLHALGLGEDPPTSLDITLQVGRRCGP